LGSGQFDACLLQSAHDCLPGALTAGPSRSTVAVTVGAERADPLVPVMSSLKANVDIALTGVGLEQVEHE